MIKERRYDLDWLRVLVFGLLIFYHVGQFFVPWNWHLTNNITYEWMTYPMLFVNQWRLSILFMISGMGTCFALAHRSKETYMKERLVRLGIPLIFGMLIIVPPQIYCERLAYGGYQGTYLHYILNDAFTGIYPTGNISWHHLWFLPYLLIYSLLLTPVFIYLRGNRDTLIIRLSKSVLNKKYGIFIFTIPLFLTEAFLEPYFNVTHALIDDWFALANYLILFFYGFLFIHVKHEFWKAILLIKRELFFLGIILFVVYLFILSKEDSTIIHFAEAFVKVINYWTWILVLFAYAATYLNKKSTVLSYCNTAVYPFYILHQTITVVLGYLIMNWEAPFITKFLILSIGTFLLCWILYEIIRRITVMRPFFGLKSRTRLKTENTNQSFTFSK